MKIQKKESTTLLLQITGIGLFILLLGLILIPRLLVFIAPSVETGRLNSFIKQTTETGKVDAQSYWHFREFYSPGSLIYQKSGLPKDSLSNILSQIDFKAAIPFLSYSSPKLKSVDLLIPQESQRAFLLTIPTKRTILLKKEDVLLSEDDHTYLLVFTASKDKMKTTIPFFDYEGSDKELLNDKEWVNITLIQK
jgi:hypothetical protein